MEIGSAGSEVEVVVVVVGQKAELDIRDEQVGEGGRLAAVRVELLVDLAGRITGKSSSRISRPSGLSGTDLRVELLVGLAGRMKSSTSFSSSRVSGPSGLSGTDSEGIGGGIAPELKIKA